MNKLEQIVTNAEPEARIILEEFVHEFANVIKEINALKQKIDYIAHDNRLLRKKLFGSSSEKLTIEEPFIQDDLLFNEFLAFCLNQGLIIPNHVWIKSKKRILQELKAQLCKQSFGVSR